MPLDVPRLYVTSVRQARDRCAGLLAFRLLGASCDSRRSATQE